MARRNNPQCKKAPQLPGSPPRRSVCWEIVIMKTKIRILFLYLILSITLLAGISSAEPEEVERDGSFILYDNGVVYDSKTKLEWFAAPDEDINWLDTLSWMKNLTVAGGGWRMPTKNELKTLYKKGKGRHNITPLFKTTGWWIWSDEMFSQWKPWSFYLKEGRAHGGYPSNSGYSRGFAVRLREKSE